MTENEEILRLVCETEEEIREFAFGSDHCVFCKSTKNGETTGWNYVGNWKNFSRLEKIAFEKYLENWIVAWNGKYKPKGWKGND